MSNWSDRIPNIEDGNVGWAVLWLNNVEAYNDFETNAAKVREVARTDPERYAAYQQAYNYLLEQPPSALEWLRATGTPFCTRDQLHEYLQAFVDYVFGNRPKPIIPPPNDELCGHERNDRGMCVLAAAEADTSATTMAAETPSSEDEDR